jgi:hypothetical protein
MLNSIMANTHYFYTRMSLKELESVVLSFQKEFDNLLEDTFTEDELTQFEAKIDAIAAIYAQPILSELTFDDLYADPKNAVAQKSFFEACRSSVSLENLPYLEGNPFQVTYIIQLLRKFSEVLVDKGGVFELVFKEQYLNDLKKFNTIDSLMALPVQKQTQVITSKPVDPIDFLILDVYKELSRLESKELGAAELSPKVQKILEVMRADQLNADQLLRKTGLNAKDFDDGLERLKFWLKKL